MSTSDARKWGRDAFHRQAWGKAHEHLAFGLMMKGERDDAGEERLERHPVGSSRTPCTSAMKRATSSRSEASG